jgi:hypothetical protein
MLISLLRCSPIPQVAAGSLRLHRGGEEEGDATTNTFASQSLPFTVVGLLHCTSLHAGNERKKIWNLFLLLRTCTNRDAFVFSFTRPY